MANRDVTQTGKDKDGDITKLCNPDEDWSPKWRDDAIDDIESKLHRYYVDVGGAEVDIHVVEGPGGKKYLRTSSDDTENNNLDELPDC